MDVTRARRREVLALALGSAPLAFGAPFGDRVEAAPHVQAGPVPGPSVGVSVAPAQVRQGRAALVEIRLAGEEAVTVAAVSAYAGPATAYNAAGDPHSADAVPLRLVPVPPAAGGPDRRFLGLVGVPFDAPTGQWFVTARARAVEAPAARAPNPAPRGEAELVVLDGAFSTQRLGFAGELLDLLAPAVGEQERLTIAAVMAESAPAPLWQGAFQLPVTGRLVTTHGARRDYLDPGGRVLAHSQHSGVDLAVPGGTLILAPAAGVVAFTGRWSIRGNVVVLDHGAGIHSLYAHALDFAVTAGQTVVAGQPVARVGSTGLSTGPHLHWEVRAGGVAVEPLEWTQRDLLAL